MFRHGSICLFHFDSQNCIFIALYIDSNREEDFVRENLPSAPSQYLSINYQTLRKPNNFMRVKSKRSLSRPSPRENRAYKRKMSTKREMKISPRTRSRSIMGRDNGIQTMTIFLWRETWRGSIYQKTNKRRWKANQGMQDLQYSYNIILADVSRNYDLVRSIS